ncbi:MAG TPA: amidohydrolase family protein, partial [Candidatus Limnocylindrales bacterium]|nr:amidohydrolase family protein [Candidatus Limnocylindrales bacterium]
MLQSPPLGPPFAIRARILTPLARGGTRYEADGRLEVDERGRLTAVGPFHAEPGDDQRPPIDLRPLVLMPGMIDMHVHLPQLPNAGVGAGLHLLDWLERYIFPLERGFDEATAERLTPSACRAFAAAGTTTAVMYGAVYEPSLDAAFRAVEAHGMRAVIGKVMMDRGSYDTRLPENTILDVSLRQSADLCSRWHGKDDGRLQYAFTPRFAITCSREMLR